MATTMVGRASPVTPESLGHAADVAMAAAAAAAAAATRRSRARRRDVDQTGVGNSVPVVGNPVAAAASSTASAGTRVDSKPGTRRTRPVAAGELQVSPASVQAVSSASGISTQDSAGSCAVRRTDGVGSPSVSSNCNHVDDDSRRSPVSAPVDWSTTGKPQVSETPSTTTTAGCTSEKAKATRTTDVRTADDDRRPSANETDADGTANDDVSVGDRDATSAGEPASSSSKLSFIKSILSRTRSPSPRRRSRRSRSSRPAMTSASPSSVLRLGAEVAQRIGDPVKGVLRQLRQRSGSRPRPTAAETDAAAKTPAETQPDRALAAATAAGAMDGQPRSRDAEPADTGAARSGHDVDVLI